MLRRIHIYCICLQRFHKTNKIVNMKSKIYTLVASMSLLFTTMYAGNPDRQGQSGASELLLNPWGRSAGLHSMSTSFSKGVEAMRINIAGLSRINKMEIAVSNNVLYSGSGMNFNSIGMGIKIGKTGALGFELASLNFGDIPITVAESPAGTGGTFSPGFFQMGVGYSFTYANKISVGALFRGISETVIDVRAFGYSIDAGVQYVSGDKDNFKLGIALRNVGSPMVFGGEGLTVRKDQGPYVLSYDAQAASFELPSMLNIGLSYDFYLQDKVYLRSLANFTSNAFSRDHIGAGVELSYHERVTLRAGYKYELNSDVEKKNLYSGFAGGVTVDFPLDKSGTNNLGIDYAYRTTNVFKGSHNFTIRYAF
jgi:hypothetical protein